MKNKILKIICFFSILLTIFIGENVFAITDSYGEWARVDKNSNNAIYFDDPSSVLYGKDHFYVMKYEARKVDIGGSYIPKSITGGTLWTQISLTQADQACQLVGGNLITNDEWMAIARDVETIPSNWASGVVGIGNLKQGNIGIESDGSYAGSDPDLTSSNSKAMFLLSNGDQVWHMSGNMDEIVNMTILNPEMPLPYAGCLEFNQITDWGTKLNYNDVAPSNNFYTSSNGIGRIGTDSDNAWPTSNVHMFIRGGDRSGYACGSSMLNSENGLFGLNLYTSPSLDAGTSLTFRCAKFDMPDAGVCGSAANGEPFLSTDTGYVQASRPQCSLGTASSNVFPIDGTPSNWYCVNSGVNSPQCTATKNRKAIIADGVLSYSAYTNGKISFNGFNVSDLDGDELDYGWWCNEGGGSFTNSSLLNPEYIAPSIPGVYTCGLVVSDQHEITLSSNVTITVSTASVDQCGDPIIDVRDGKTYNTVQIGNQCWLKENLNIGTRINTPTLQGTSCSSIQKYCYENNEANCDTYGGLYTWTQAMCGSVEESTQGICPAGWHLPSDNEIKELEMFLGMTQEQADLQAAWRGTDQGTQLKIGGSSGFNAQLGGLYNYWTTYGFLNGDALLWASTTYGSGNAWHRLIRSSEPTIYRYVTIKKDGMSVRCVKPAGGICGAANQYIFHSDDIGYTEAGKNQCQLGDSTYTGFPVGGVSANWYCNDAGLNSPQCSATKNRKAIINNGTLNYSVNTLSQVSFIGFSASDLDGDNLNYAWSCNNGGTFVDNSVVNPIYNAPDSARTDTCSLLVSDGIELTLSAVVTITVSTSLPICTWTCSEWGNCQSDNTQTRICSTTQPCLGDSPFTTQFCDSRPPLPIYHEW
ncbi:MAG: FISUMP domain-containing protein [Candidatus Paceibacterota bacterium]|jgi:uncharacterized protein (TIGR02145 family)